MRRTPIAMHAERTSDPEVLRWVFKDKAIGPAVPVRVDRSGDRSHPLADLLLATIPEVASVEVCDRRLDVRKTRSASWSALATSIQDRLRDDVDRTAAPPDSTHDLPAEQARVAALIEAAVGRVVAAHGGRIEVVDVSGREVTVRLHGACRGCPASRTTLERALDGELRARFPGLESICVSN